MLLQEWNRDESAGAGSQPQLFWHGSGAPLPSESTTIQGTRNLAFRLSAAPERTWLFCRNLPVAEVRGNDVPLQNETMGRIVLWHLLKTGLEPEMAEARRLLQPGGQLVVVGLNRYGWKYLARRRGSLPGFGPLALCSRMQRSRLQLERFLAAGFMGSNWPARADLGIARAVAPVCDVFLLAFRHDEPKLAGKISKANLSAAGAR